MCAGQSQTDKQLIPLVPRLQAGNQKKTFFNHGEHGEHGEKKNTSASLHVLHALHGEIIFLKREVTEAILMAKV